MHKLNVLLLIWAGNYNANNCSQYNAIEIFGYEDF